MNGCAQRSSPQLQALFLLGGGGLKCGTLSQFAFNPLASHQSSSSLETVTGFSLVQLETQFQEGMKHCISQNSPEKQKVELHLFMDI